MGTEAPFFPGAGYQNPTFLSERNTDYYKWIASAPPNLQGIQATAARLLSAANGNPNQGLPDNGQWKHLRWGLFQPFVLQKFGTPPLKAAWPAASRIMRNALRRLPAPTPSGNAPNGAPTTANNAVDMLDALYQFVFERVAAPMPIPSEIFIRVQRPTSGTLPGYPNTNDGRRRAIFLGDHAYTAGWSVGTNPARDILTVTVFCPLGGWIGYVATDTPDTDWTELHADWTVPDAPTNNQNQVVFIFLGAESTQRNSGNGHPAAILQPVLQWGYSPYCGGGPYWQLRNWYMPDGFLVPPVADWVNGGNPDSAGDPKPAINVSNGEIRDIKKPAMSEGIVVSAGESVQGRIVRTSTLGPSRRADYTCSFTYNGAARTLSAQNITQLEYPVVAVEAYNFSTTSTTPGEDDTVDPGVLPSPVIFTAVGKTTNGTPTQIAFAQPLDFLYYQVVATSTGSGTTVSITR